MLRVLGLPSKSAEWKRNLCLWNFAALNCWTVLGDGAVDGIGFWDPSVAGYAMNKLAQMVIDGQKVTDGMNLGLQGYENVKLDGKVIYGQAWVNVNKGNMADYPF